MTHTILVVDDDLSQRNILQHVITEKLGYRGIMLSSGQEAIEWVQKAKKPNPDLSLLDYELGNHNALDVMRLMRDHALDLPVVVVTAYGDMEKASACIKAGAFDFLSKPVNIERLGVSLRNTLHAKFLQHQLQSFERYPSGGVSFSQMVGNNTAFRTRITQATKAAQSVWPLLICGEAGVGKTMLARAVHGNSARSRHPFVTLACGELQEASSTLAVEKNAMQNGNKLYEKILEANQGTLYLHHVCKLSLPQQAMLLRVLQENELPMNGSATPVDIRVISSNVRSLDALVQKGEFRGDLLHRLSHTTIALPALRERRDDIHLLVDYFIRKYAATEFKTVRSISPAALGMLVSYAWVGNVRQLENKIFRAVALSDRTQLDVNDFDILRRGGEEQPEYHLHEQNQSSPYHAPSLENTSLMSLVGPSGHMKRMDQLEVEAIRYALQYYKGHMSEVARRLGIGRSTLYRKIHDFDIA